MNAFRDEIIETSVIGEFKTQAAAKDFLAKRDYTFDDLAQAYIRGNTVQYPVVIQPPTATSVFDIRTFIS